MRPNVRTVAQWSWPVLAALTWACGQGNFPVSPSPIAATPITTLQTASYQGFIVQGAQVTPFNMTLIARALGARTADVAAQAPGTTVVNGHFETGAGLTGTVDGTLTGTLESGTLSATLATATSGGCNEERAYTGLVTGNGIALVPGDHSQSCPSNALDFTVQVARPGGSTCSFSVAPGTVSVSGSGGTANVSVFTDGSCAWTAESTVPWAALDGPATHSGSATVTIRVAGNDGGPRSSSLRIAGQTITVNQGAKCTYSVDPTSARVAGSG